MGNGSSHGKDAQRTEKPPKGARVIGESGKIERFGEEDEIELDGEKNVDEKVEAKKP